MVTIAQLYPFIQLQISMCAHAYPAEIRLPGFRCQSAASHKTESFHFNSKSKESGLYFLSAKLMYHMVAASKMHIE